MAINHKCAAELIVRCFDARTQAHLFHLQALDSSIALHMALEKFYEALPDLVDAFAESYQGVHGLIPYRTYPAAPCGANSPLDMLQDLRAWIMAERENIGGADDSEIQNAIDEIVTLVNHTLYRTRFFK